MGFGIIIVNKIYSNKIKEKSSSKRKNVPLKNRMEHHLFLNK